MLLPLSKGRLREYCWPVSSYSGQTLRIALIDSADKPDRAAT